MSTGLELITDAFAELGIATHGDSLSPEMSAHGLRKLNRMLSKDSAELSMIYAETLTTHTWPASTASQTIGSGGDITATRPITITGVQVRIDSTDYPVKLVSYEAYEGILRKSDESTFPQVCAYKKEYPLGILYINMPMTSSATVRIQSKDALTALTLAGSVSLPDGYEEYIVSNLALSLCGKSYGRYASQEMIDRANKSKKALKAINQVNNEMWPDVMTPGVYARHSTTTEYND